MRLAKSLGGDAARVSVCTEYPHAAPMGTSFTKYREEGFWSRDATLEIWLWALVRAFDCAPDRHALLRGAVKHWRDAYAQGATGCVHAALDEHLGDDAHRAAAATLARNALEFIRAFPDGIPSADLERDRVGGDGRWLTPHVAVDAVERLGELFVDLVDGHVVGTARDLELLHWIERGARKT